MNLVRCNNGHFYDKDKFSSCPHCKDGAGAAAGGQTVPLSGTGAAAPVGGGYMGSAGDVTMPMGNGPAPAPSPAGMQETVPLSDIAPTPGFQGGGATLSDETVALSQKETVPVDAAPVGSASSINNMKSVKGTIDPVTPEDKDPWANNTSTRFPQEEDDVKTIGIFAPSMMANEGKESAVEPVVGWLVCIKGDSFGRSMPLKSGKNFIGRDISNDVIIPDDKSISRQCHAILVYDPRSHEYLVQPGISRELFYLNNKVVLEVKEIHARDILSIGKTDLMFVPFCGDDFTWEDQLKKNNESL